MIPGRVAALRKMRLYLLESIAEAADEIAAIDREISRLRSQQPEAEKSAAGAET